ncbi:MAG: uncharacterized protein QG597_4054, partial [Actinomycetota bacterium]|nr:uncharacterized protein [Actinomycetota bacterium]
MRHPEGLFGWIDLTTSDVAAAKDFYTGLFGWTSVDLPTPMGVDYTQFSIDGKLVAGMGPLPPEMAAGGMPSFWSSYVITADLDAALGRVAEAGGQVVVPAMDVMEQGRMAMVADPSGGIVGLWQPMAHEGAEVFNVPGALTWNELQSRDIAAAMPFYTDAFGWVWQEGPSPDYFIANLPTKEGEDKSNAGAMAMPPGVPDEAPSFWLIYIAVADCDATMAKAQELGGSVMFPAMQMGPG